MTTKNTTKFKFLLGLFLWTILLGNANGQSFTSVFHAYNGFPGIDEIVHGDFNGDGSLDFVITTGNNTVGLSVKVGLGDGISSPVYQDLETELYLINMEVVDFDQDGDLDFVGAAPFEMGSFLYKNDGSANFTREELPFSNYNAVHFADLDNDGQIEMLITFSERLELYTLNQGVTTFNQIIYEEGFFNPIYSLTTVDFDQDGDLDVVANSTLEGVVLFTQTDALSFAQQLLFEDSSTDSELIAADFNQDGIFDFMRHDEFDSRTSVILSSADSVYDETILPNLFATNMFSTATDVDLDGETEIIVLDGSSFVDEILLYNYNATTNQFDQSSINSEFTIIVDGGTVDLDGDGDLDLYLWGANSFSVGTIFLINDAITSIHELAEVTINVYPNPATSIINLDIAGELNYELSILDLQGRTIKNTRNNAQIDVQDIPFGIYILEITDLDSGQSVLERIVIED